MRLAITGSTGLIGTAVVAHFKDIGYDIIPLIRKDSKKGTRVLGIHWDFLEEKIDISALEGIDVIVHLAGASIVTKRWGERYKKIIRQSRVSSTKFLSESLAQLNNPPKIFLCASAIGFYGNQPAQRDIDETVKQGEGFLSDVCREWEAATQAAEDRGIRVVHMRMGAVLSSKGGALRKMLPIFRLGLGGKLGSGRQMFSWIALDEIPSIMEYVISQELLKGAINFTAPISVTNSEFTKVLGRVIRRPTVFSVPGCVIKLLFGEMGEELLLSGARILPKKLLDHGYQFLYPDAESALKAAN